MSTKTRDELVEAAANRLMIIGNGQPFEDEDFDKIDANVEPLIEQLAADSVIEIDNVEEIQSCFFIPLSELLANVSASSFGLPYSEDKKRVYEGQITKSAASLPTYAVATADYF